MSWVTAHTGAALAAPPGLAELGLRSNPRRAHLLVSLLLGKHIPVSGVTVLRAASDLGGLVRTAVGPAEPYVVGFAETATALGHGVAAVAAADCGAAAYAHTTRRPAPAGVQPVHFEEEHSHAVEQSLGLLDDTVLRDPAVALVLVDDELSSGRTAVNAVRALQSRWPRERYVLATLLDVRSDEQRAATVAAVAAMGAQLDDVCLGRGQVRLPDDLPARAAQLVLTAASASGSTTSAEIRTGGLLLPAGTPLTGAFGWDRRAEMGLVAAADRLADALRDRLCGNVLVMGDEEFMYLAHRVAAALGVRTSSTTRSPALAVDDPDYPLRSALRFPSTDDPSRDAFAYNVRGGGFDTVVLLVDRPARPGLVNALAGSAVKQVHVVQIRAGAARTATVTA